MTHSNITYEPTEYPAPHWYPAGPNGERPYYTRESVEEAERVRALHVDPAPTELRKMAETPAALRKPIASKTAVGAPGVTGKVKTCIVCGNEFRNRNGRAVTCSYTCGLINKKNSLTKLDEKRRSDRAKRQVA